MVVYTPAAAEIEAWVGNMARQVHGEMPEEYDIINGYVVNDAGDEE
jgi:hypothetical protein